MHKNDIVLHISKCYSISLIAFCKLQSKSYVHLLLIHGSIVDFYNTLMVLIHFEFSFITFIYLNLCVLLFLNFFAYCYYIKL